MFVQHGWHLECTVFETASPKVASTNHEGIGQEVSGPVARDQESRAHLQALSGMATEAERVDLMHSLVKSPPSLAAARSLARRLFPLTGSYGRSEKRLKRSSNEPTPNDASAPAHAP